jgi:hypothetical protein
VERDRPADERHARATVVHPQRSGCERRVEELPAAVYEAACVAAGRAMFELERDLLHVHPRVHGVDRHPCLRAEARRERKDSGARFSGKRALSRERLRRLEARAEADEGARGRLRNPEAAALTPRKDGDPQAL